MKKKQQQLRLGRKNTREPKKKGRPISGHKDRTIKQLLGSLYADREFLEKLLKEEGRFFLTIPSHTLVKQVQINPSLDRWIRGLISLLS